MLLDLQLHKFDVLVRKLISAPEDYIQFESVSDFYKASWLNDFPQGTTWTVSGLDDGADEFCILITYKNHNLMIDIADKIQIYRSVVSEKLTKNECSSLCVSHK